MLPLGAECVGSELQGVWDLIVSGVIEDCQPSKIDQNVPDPSPGYYSDLWLLKDEMLSRLRRHPGFVAAQERVSRMAGQQCAYSDAQEPNLLPCDLYCRQFNSLVAIRITLGCVG